MPVNLLKLFILLICFHSFSSLPHFEPDNENVNDGEPDRENVFMIVITMRMLTKHEMLRFAVVQDFPQGSLS